MSALTIQREQARLLANQVRTQRTALRCRLNTRSVHITSLIADPPSYVTGMRVVDLLDLSPSPGGRVSVTPRKRSRHHRLWLPPLNLRAARANVNLLGEVGALTPRQRSWLVAELRRLYGIPLSASDYDVLERDVFPGAEAA